MTDFIRQMRGILNTQTLFLQNEALNIFLTCPVGYVAIFGQNDHVGEDYVKIQDRGVPDGYYLVTEEDAVAYTLMGTVEEHEMLHLSEDNEKYRKIAKLWNERREDVIEYMSITGNEYTDGIFI